MAGINTLFKEGRRRARAVVEAEKNAIRRDLLQHYKKQGEMAPADVSLTSQIMREMRTSTPGRFSLHDMRSGNMQAMEAAMARASTEEVVPTYDLSVTIAKVPITRPPGWRKGGKLSLWKMVDPRKIHVGVSGADLKLLQARAAMEAGGREIVGEPEFFFSDEGKWIPWILQRILQEFDRARGDLMVTFAAVDLSVMERFTPARLLAARTDPHVFDRILDVDRIYDSGKRVGYDRKTRTLQNGLGEV